MLLQTIKTNLRDILVGVTIVLAVSFAADVANKLAVTNNGVMWLANVVAVMNGLATFAAANLGMWFMLAVAWPTINRFSNEKFYAAWQTLTLQQQFSAFIAVAAVEGIMAAICFS